MISPLLKLFDEGKIARKKDFVPALKAFVDSYSQRLTELNHLMEIWTMADNHDLPEVQQVIDADIQRLKRFLTAEAKAVLVDLATPLWMEAMGKENDDHSGDYKSAEPGCT